MTVAFAEVLALETNIAEKTRDGFPYEVQFRQAMVALYALSFLISGFHVMHLVMVFTVRFIVIAQTPAHLVALALQNEEWKNTMDRNPLSVCFYRIMRCFCIAEVKGSGFVEPNLHLMGIGYCIGLYLTQGWEVAVPSFVFIVWVYRSMRLSVAGIFKSRRKVIQFLKHDDKYPDSLYEDSVAAVV